MVDNLVPISFPKLVPAYKWLQRQRNVKICDVCLIRYRNEARSTYRLGRVQEVKLGQDGLVRSVALQYKLPTENKYQKVDQPIHRICVIVPIKEPSTLNPKAPDYVPQ